MALIYFGKDKKSSEDARATQERAAAAALAEIRGYWESLRLNGGLPHRADIDPRGMRGALEGAFLIERIGPGIGRLRVAGTNFTDLLGMDARGMPLSAIFDPMARARMAPLLDNCFLKPAIVDISLSAETGLGRSALTARMTLLPVEGDGMRSEMALGCLMLSGDVGRAPRRFSITAAHCSPLTLPRLEAQDPMAGLAALAADPGDAPAGDEYAADLAPQVTSAGAHLASERDTPIFTETRAGDQSFQPLKLRALPGFTEKPNARNRPWLRLVDLER